MAHAVQTGTKKNTGRIALQSLFILVVVLAALFSLKFSVAEYLALSKNVYLDMSSELQTNPDILADLARLEHTTGNLDKARQLYVRALDSFILHAPSWLGLAEVLKDQGQKNQAAAALQTFDSLHVDDIDLIWQKAELAQSLDQDKILLSTLKWLAENDKKHRSRVFDIAGEYWDNPRHILQVFAPACYPDILRFFIRKDQREKVETVWNELDRSGFRSPETTIAYVSFLLKNNEFDPAAAAWRTTFQQNGALLHNGSFETPILDTAFGWEASEAKGVSLDYEDFGGGLTISFDGTDNVAFMLSQVVPLFPGEHIFHGFFETTNLTSQQRPYWLISGYNCQGLYIEDTMLPPSAYTTEFAIAFAVPDSCKAIKIDLIRNRANTYDSLISGSVTLKNLNIERISPPPPDRAEPEKAPPEPVISPAPKPAAELFTEAEKVKTQTVKTELIMQETDKKSPDKTQELQPQTTILINSLIIQ